MYFIDVFILFFLFYAAACMCACVSSVRERVCERVRVSSTPPDVDPLTVPHRAPSTYRTLSKQKYLRTRGPCPPYPGLEVGNEEDAAGAAGGGGLTADAIQVNKYSCPCPCCRILANNVHQQHAIASF